MVAERITVGVYALDRVILPKPAGAKGWAARLAEALPVLTDGEVPVPIHLSEGPEGLVLTEDAPLGLEHPAGSAVAVEPVAGRPGFSCSASAARRPGFPAPCPGIPEVSRPFTA